jgi:signal transduction histidine kinase
LEDIEKILDEIQETLRTLTVELNPPVLYRQGLIAALEWLAVNNFEKYGLKVKLDLQPDAEPEHKELRYILFDAVRELLLNIVKHADTRQAEIKLALDRKNHIRLVVSDKGRGFLYEQLSHKRTGGMTLGLFNIRQHLNFIGGRMKIQSKTGKGTRIELIVPPVVHPAQNSETTPKRRRDDHKI